MSEKMKRYFRGMWRSWSARFSYIAIALGGIDQYTGALTSWIGAKWAGAAVAIGGFIGLVLRAKTTKSLEERGK